MIHLFSVLNKTTGRTDLVKAETRTQVSKFLSNNFTIEKATALDVADIMVNGGIVQDATATVVDAVADAGAVGVELAGADTTDHSGSGESATVLNDHSTSSTEHSTHHAE